MSEQLKAEVLAKCWELAPEKWTQGHVLFGGYETLVTRKGGGYWELCRCGISIHVAIGNEDDWIGWPLAAQILEIQMPNERPSNELLWEAFIKGNSVPTMPINLASPCFDAWLSTLPADPLEADREIADEVLWESAEIFEDSIDLPLAASKSPHTSREIFEAILRLCGKGVNHG